MQELLIGAGIALMAGAIIGGGLSAFGVELPVFSSVGRQILLFLLGAVLLFIGLDPTSGPDSSPVPTDIPVETSSPPGDPPPSEVPSDDTPSETATTPREPPPPVTMGPLEIGVNRQGNDFDAFGIHTDNEQLCAEECRNQASCKAMTYVKSKSRCWLKAAVPPPTADADMVSAIKNGA